MENGTIAFGGGCFWCTEAVLQRVPGVVDVTPGYSGGYVPDPTYRQVCGGETGHAEVVLVSYDAEKVSLRALLEAFLASHDPTSLNRQGADVGTQYRSIILYTDEEQRRECERFLREAAPRYRRPIVTELKKLEAFYPAEDYHRRYYERNPRQPYCRLVIAPKLERLGKTVKSDRNPAR